MPTETTWNPNTNTYDSRETKTQEDVTNAQAASAAGTTAGKGLGAKERPGRKPMPKQSDYPDTATWSAALRQWRQDDDSAANQAGQAKAVAGMK